jgi:signal transduction histidine kinase
LQRTLPSSPQYHLAFRVAGLFIWAFLSLPAFDSSTRKGEALSSGPWIAWLVLFFAFAPAFWISSSPQPRSSWARVLALAVQTICVLGMTAIFQGYLVGFLLVLVTWQVALVLPLRAALVWAIADSCLWIFFQEPHYHLGWRWSATGALLGFQAFAMITAAMARSEAAAREDQARINADLVSTRELLRETSKAGERIRIARELHDVVGHNLTALCLHLEAALHLSGNPLQVTLEKALQLARQMLNEVRTVVSGFHDQDHIDLRRAFEVLQQNVPRIALAIEIPDDLAITDAARAHAVVRCVQEITTNTLKHSDSRNLWVRIYLREGAIEIEAHDDGSKVEQSKSGIGISAMRRRLEELGGGLTIDPSPGHGFHVKAWLPVGDAMEAR